MATTARTGRTDSTATRAYRSTRTSIGSPLTTPTTRYSPRIVARTASRNRATNRTTQERFFGCVYHAPRAHISTIRKRLRTGSNWLGSGRIETDGTQPGRIDSGTPCRYLCLRRLRGGSIPGVASNALVRVVSFSLCLLGFVVCPVSSSCVPFRSFGTHPGRLGRIRDARIASSNTEPTTLDASRSADGR